MAATEALAGSDSEIACGQAAWLAGTLSVSHLQQQHCSLQPDRCSSTSTADQC